MRVIAAALAIALLAACAGHKSQPLPKPVVRRIAIIPATNPQTYTLYNATPPVGYPFQFWVNKADSANKELVLNERLQHPPLDLAKDLTQAVADDLRGHGLEVIILQDLQRTPGEPDSVDYDKITTDADVILHLWIQEVGLYSSHTSAYYIPRFNASGAVFVKGRDDTLYSQDVYYGVDAKKGKSWAIAPDPKFAYRYFEDVLDRFDEVRSAFETGADEVGKKMSGQIYEAIK
jgi:hypothetical protein